MGGKANTSTNSSTNSGSSSGAQAQAFNQGNYASTGLQGQYEASYNNLLGRANLLSQSGYTPFTGTTNGALNSATSTLTNASGAGSPYYSGAGGALGGAAQMIGASTAPAYTNVQNYMNPYQSGVINATLANMNQQNQQQQQGVIGNAIAQGALGGDRVAVAQAQLGGQQALANNQVLAGLNSQNYSQALGAAQNQQQQQLAAGSALGNVGANLGNIGSEATNSQVSSGLGALQAGENTYNNQYQQYQNAQAFPYQQLSWLQGLTTNLGTTAGGFSYDSGMGSSNGTSSGTSTGVSNSTQTTPTGNGISQAVGGVLGLGSLFLSDRRVKEGIEPIGKTFDGQTVYRYNYKGDPRTQIGLIAQDVEKKHPRAVGTIINGIKGVDYHDATEDSAEKGHFAEGGGVVPYGGSAFAGSEIQPPAPVSGAINIPRNLQMQAPPMGGAPPIQVPAAQGQQGQQGQQNANGINQMLNSAKQWKQLGQQGEDALGRMAGNDSTDGSVPIASPISSDMGGGNEGFGGDLGGEGGLFKRGGIVRGYDDGGVVGGDGLPLNPDSGIVGADGQIFDPNIGWMPATDAANTANVGNAPAPGVVAAPADTATPDTFQQPAHPASSPHALMNPMAPWANIGDSTAAAALPDAGVVPTAQAAPIASTVVDPNQGGGIISPAAAATLPNAPIQPPLKNLTPEDAQKLADAGYNVPVSSVQAPAPMDTGSASSNGVVPPLPPAQYIKPVPRPRQIQGENGPVGAPATVPAAAPGSGGVVRPNVSPADAAIAAQPSGGGGSVQEAVLARIASGEAKGFNQLYGGGTFNDYSQFPQWSGKMGPAGISHAAGLLQMQPATWAMEAKKLGLTDFSPQSQLAAGWDLAKTTYKQNTGRDIEADAANGNVQWNALGSQWSSLKGAKPGPVGSASLPTAGGTQENLGNNTDVTGSTPSSGVVAPTGQAQQAGAAGQTSGSFLDSIRDHLGGRNFFSPEERMALMSAGFGMMGGTSRNPWVNIGQGAQQGIQTYRQGQQLSIDRGRLANDTARTGFEGQTVQQGAQRLANQAEQFKQNLGIEQQKVGIEQTNQQMQRFDQQVTPAGIMVRDKMNPTVPPRIITWDQMNASQQPGADNSGSVQTGGNPPAAPAAPVTRPAVTSGAPGASAGNRPMLSAGQVAPSGSGDLANTTTSAPAAPIFQTTAPRPKSINPMVFSPIGQKVVEGQATDTLKQADSDASAAQSTNLQLEEMKRDLATLPATGILTPGAGFHSRLAFATAVDTALQSAGLPGLTPDEQKAAGQDLNKLTTRLGFDLAKTLGTREAGFIVNQAVGAVPGGANSATGAKRIIAGIQAGNQRKIDLNNFVTDWAQKNGGDTTNAVNTFNKINPPELYALSAYVPPQAINNLRQHPDSAAQFESFYGKGTSRYVLGAQ